MENLAASIREKANAQQFTKKDKKKRVEIVVVLLMR